jgi:phospho-N-acetylmuramoyl-pentapeptide-transferase
MSLLLGLLIFSFIINAIAIVPFINLLYRLRFYKQKTAVGAHHKDTASEHIRAKARTPEGAGLLIIVVVSLIFAFCLPIIRFLGVYISGVHQINEELNIIFFTFISFGLLGLYDDIVKYFELDRDLGYAGLKTRHKFIIQIILGLIIGSLLYFNLGIEIINIPLIGVINLGFWYIFFAAFIVIAFANAVNITDGLDGLAGGLLMISLFGFWFLSASILDTPLSIFLALWIGSLIAFLYFNVFPARIFLGDVGALSFGATFAIVALLLGKVVALLIVGLPFIIDGGSSLIQILSIKLRKKRILPIAPIHYYLLRIGWAENKIVQRAWLMGVMLVVFGVWLSVI